jgi:hypothetical protein
VIPGNRQCGTSSDTGKAGQVKVADRQQALLRKKPEVQQQEVLGKFSLA